MAKAEKTVPPEVATLMQAAAVLDRGDNVSARALAQSVLSTALPADENSKELQELATRFTSEDETVSPTLHSVAATIISRSGVPVKIYGLAAAAAGSFLLLLVLAISRY